MKFVRLGKTRNPSFVSARDSHSRAAVIFLKFAR